MHAQMRQNRSGGTAGGGWVEKRSRARALAGAVLAISLVLAPSASRADELPPPGVTQLLPRGGIPAIFDPQFVPADVAQIPDSAWIFGVVIDGDARAYDLSILNHHEIVNDVVGDVPVAPVW